MEKVKLDGSYLAMGLDKDNNMLYSRFVIKFDVKPEIAGLPGDKNIAGEFTLATEVSDINKTNVEEQTFDENNSKPLKSLNEM